MPAETPQLVNNRYATTRLLVREQPAEEICSEDRRQSSFISAAGSADRQYGGLRTRGYGKQSLKGLPLVSVVTVVYQGEAHVEQAIASVLNQTYDNIEYIVIDGASTDATVAIIRRYGAMIDYWLSEPDRGISDAMNKGTALASGDYVFFLHADDYFADERSMSEAMNCLTDANAIMACDIMYGSKLTRKTPRGFNFWMNFKTGVYHQGVLCRRDLLLELNGFDTQFRIAMDYDLFLRAYQSGTSIKKIPVILTVMRDTGISSRTGWRDLLLRYKEEKAIHKKNCRTVAMRIAYTVYWILYPTYRALRYWLR